MKRILLVDDEVQILKSLSRAFFDTDYDILTAENGEAALKILEENEVNLVISDMRMPIMDGYELLSRIKSKHPKVMRVILSGYSEEQCIIKALIRNIAKVYIFKPWNNEELLQCIKQLFVTEDLLNSSDLLLLINNLDEIPTIQASYNRLLYMIENDEDIKKISEEIEKDFAISTKILQVVNSAYYGLKTGSILQACIYLGLQNIRNLVLSTSIINAINVSHFEQHYFDILWKHALLTNRLLSFLYQKLLHKKMPEAALSAGLLHNIGILIMRKQLFGQYSSFKKANENVQCSILDIELAEFKVTHQEVGGYLLSWWELPFPIVEAALFHHRPFDPNIVNTELVSCVHIAQRYAWDIMNEPEFTPFFPEVFERVGINQQEFEEKINNETWL
jgi:HD-like signal output (HDOD) protein